MEQEELRLARAFSSSAQREEDRQVCLAHRSLLTLPASAVRKRLKTWNERRHAPPFLTSPYVSRPYHGHLLSLDRSLLLPPTPHTLCLSLLSLSCIPPHTHPLLLLSNLHVRPSHRHRHSATAPLPPTAPLFSPSYPIAALFHRLSIPSLRSSPAPTDSAEDQAEARGNPRGSACRACEVAGGSIAGTRSTRTSIPANPCLT